MVSVGSEPSRSPRPASRTTEDAARSRAKTQGSATVPRWMEPRRARRTLGASVLLAGPEGLDRNAQLALELLGDSVMSGSLQFPDGTFGYLTHPENFSSKSQEFVVAVDSRRAAPLTKQVIRRLPLFGSLGAD